MFPSFKGSLLNWDAMFPWPKPAEAGFGWVQGHELELGVMAKMRCDRLQAQGREDELERLLLQMGRGDRHGLWCRRCGLSAWELHCVPAVQCLPRPRIASRYFLPD